MIGSASIGRFDVGYSQRRIVRGPLAAYTFY